MPYFNLRPEFISVLLHNNLAWLQLFIILNYIRIILNFIRISDRSKQAHDVNAGFFIMNLVA